MKVEQIMTRNVKTCRPEDTLETAAQMMWDGDCGFVPVEGEGSQLAGVITDRDICMAALFAREPLANLEVGKAMSREVCSCRSYDSIDVAEKLMQARQVHRLPVTDAGGQLVGVLSLNDITLAAAMEEGKTGEREVPLESVAKTLAAICEHRPASRRVALRG